MNTSNPLRTANFALVALLTAWISISSGFAQNQELPPEAKAVLDSLKWQTGAVALPDDIASIQLAPGYRFIDGKDATAVLTKVWKNPSEQLLGMIFPDNKGPLEADWAVLIEGFEKEGYVKDEDAGKIDAPKLLKEIQDGQMEANKERAKQGFPELEIVGWAIPPYYDSAAKKLYWALDVKRVNAENHSVNYFVRILGRRGFLVINILGGLDQVEQVKAATPQILSMIDFKDGHRYTDFNPKTDKVAAYGIAGLILGGVGLKVAAKLGLAALFLKKFGAIALVLKKGGVIIIAAIVGLFSKIKQFFAGRKQEKTLV